MEVHRGCLLAYYIHTCSPGAAAQLKPFDPRCHWLSVAPKCNNYPIPSNPIRAGCVLIQEVPKNGVLYVRVCRFPSAPRPIAKFSHLAFQVAYGIGYTLSKYKDAGSRCVSVIPSPLS